MARTFNGNAANYLSATGLLYNLPTNCTIVWAARTTTTSGNLAVMGRRNSGSTGGFILYRRGDRNSAEITLFGHGEVFNFAAFDSWPADGNYRRFILTKAGSNWTLYAGSTTAAGTGTGSYTNSSEGQLVVGAYNFVGTGILDPYNGGLDQIAIFPSVLDATDRAAYIGGAAPSALAAAGADHYWAMGNAAATGETDDFGAADLAAVGAVGYENTGGGGPSGPGSLLGGLVQGTLTKGRLLA